MVLPVVCANTPGGKETAGLVGKKRQGETIMGAKHIRNVEHVKARELRPVPIGNYWGPLIPE
jgi:hypothetical protein